MKKLFILLAFVVCSFAVNAQDEGYILFDISFSNTEMSREEKEMLPKQAEMWFKGDNMRMEMPSAMMNTTIIVKKDEMYNLMDFMGNKIAMKSTKEEIEKASKDSKKPKVTITGDKKNIAGYDCKKALLTQSDGSEVALWYTDKIKSNNNWNSDFSEIKGMPLEFSMKTGAVDMQMTAREVKMGGVEDSKMVVPSDYKLMTKEEMQNMFGGSSK